LAGASETVNIRSTARNWWNQGDDATIAKRCSRRLVFFIHGYSQGAAIPQLRDRWMRGGQLIQHHRHSGVFRKFQQEPITADRIPKIGKDQNGAAHEMVPLEYGIQGH